MNLMWRNQQGFTILETIVSLLIVGLLTALVVANTQTGNQRQKVRDGASRFVAAAKEAQSNALGLKVVNDETRKAYGVCITSSYAPQPNACASPGSYPADTYQLYARKLTDTNYSVAPTAPDVLSTYKLPEGTTFSTGQSWLEFQPPVPALLANGGVEEQTITIIQDSYARDIIVRPRVGAVYAQ